MHHPMIVAGLEGDAVTFDRSSSPRCDAAELSTCQKQRLPERERQ
jgi:hypothetical protein